MRPSPLRHTLAILRTTIGLTQKEMAELADCSTATVQAVELGKLQMSERLAGLIAVRTGVALSWLLDNKVDVPPHEDSADGSKKPFTINVYEQARAFSEQKFPAFDVLQSQFSYLTSLHRLAALFIKALKKKRTQLCAYKIARALDELDKVFGVGEDELEAFDNLTHKFRERPEGVRSSPGATAYAVFVGEILKLTPHYKGYKTVTSSPPFAYTFDGMMIPKPSQPTEEVQKQGDKAHHAQPSKKKPHRVPKKSRTP